MDKLFNTKKATSARKPSVQIPVGLEKVEARMIPNPIIFACRFECPPLSEKWDAAKSKQAKQTVIFSFLTQSLEAIDCLSSPNFVWTRIQSQKVKELDVVKESVSASSELFHLIISSSLLTFWFSTQNSSIHL
jgi:hypothetical protein